MQCRRSAIIAAADVPSEKTLKTLMTEARNAPQEAPDRECVIAALLLRMRVRTPLLRS